MVMVSCVLWPSLGTTFDTRDSLVPRDCIQVVDIITRVTTPVTRKSSLNGLFPDNPNSRRQTFLFPTSSGLMVKPRTFETPLLSSRVYLHFHRFVFRHDSKIWSQSFLRTVPWILMYIDFLTTVLRVPSAREVLDPHVRPSGTWWSSRFSSH